MPRLSRVTDFDLKLLKVFQVVVESGSFSAAENVLGISCSAISQQMADLEKRIGIRLCQRGRSGFALTAEGQEILMHSKVLFLSLDHFKQQVNQLHEHLAGDIQIGLINNLVTQPQMKITQALKELSLHHPDIKVNLSMCKQQDIEQSILNGHLQVGALPVVNRLTGLDYFSLYSEKFYLYCSAEHPLFNQPVQKSDVSEWNMVLLNYTMSDQFQQFLPYLNEKATASDREGVAFVILTGQFIGFLPEHYAQQWLDKGLMSAVCPEFFQLSADISIVIKKEKKKNLLLACFLKYLNLTF